MLLQLEHRINLFLSKGSKVEAPQTAHVLCTLHGCKVLLQITGSPGHTSLVSFPLQVSGKATIILG